ncbi:MAG: Arc family DNA-binding protein [Candidatus Aureabacteria bacterium]|nr:Arc family DNA-binding protein [Candidatus Auribacterota bacterium]
MATITIKDLPANVHRTLKDRAHTHGRSLNREIIATLVSTISAAVVDASAVIHHARSVREGVGIYLTQSDLKAAKDRGRR